MGTILRDLSLIWILIHCCLMFMLLYESRYSQKITNIITGIFMIPLITVNMASVMYFGIERAGDLIVLTCVLPSLIFFFIMAKNRDTRFLFTFCIIDTIILEVLIATNLLDTLLGLGNYIVMFVSRLVIIPVLEFLLVKYLRKPYHILQQYTKKGWGVFSVMAALFYITMLTVTYYPSIILKRPEYIPYLILILILVPVMYMTVFNVMWKQLALFRAEGENRVLNMQIKMVNERLSNSAKTENNLKLLRHDIKHQIILINDYIKNKDFDGAQEYISKIIKDTDKNTLKTYCNNNSVNVVLSHYHNIARLNGIDLRTDIKLPEKLSINETDFAVILSNGLDNAINALKSCDNKQITIKAFTSDDKLYLELKNPFNEDIVFDNNMPQSSKENHGYGTKSMAAIVKKHGGMYSFVTENDFFVFRCAI